MMMPTNVSVDACALAITNTHANICICNNACADDAYTFTNASANTSAFANADTCTLASTNACGDDTHADDSPNSDANHFTRIAP
jgi:hypothetical protein